MSITVLTPTGTLGYGFDAGAFRRAMDMVPDVIAVDAGSTDPGPSYLGSGKPLVPRFSIKRELTDIIAAGRAANIPVVVGSAGGAGARAHVDWTADIVREIAAERGLKFRLATIYADVPIERAKRAVRDGEVQRFEASFDLTEDLLDETVALVAQMGHEPIIQALEAGADVIVAGRAVDDCAISAHPIWQRADPALAVHMGKILECGAIAASPQGMDVMTGVLHDDHFVVEPGAESRQATVASIAAHSLYEREDPFRQAGPGHALDLTDCRFEQLDDRRVRVSGARFEEGEACWVKLEGARIAGHRTLSIAGIRCPTMIAEIDSILEAVRRETLAYFADNSLKLEFHAYGRDGVMRDLEPQKSISSHELGLVIETVADDAEIALAACHHASGEMLHFAYDGIFNTSGNLAFPYSPSEIEAGPVYVFSAYHLMKVDSPTELFPVHLEEV